MTGHTSALVGAAGAIAAGVAGGPLQSTFNELALTLAIMGAFGGATMGMANKYSWREIFRGGFLGALLAFGFGAISPQILAAVLPIDAGGSQGIPLLSATAFVVGFMQEPIVSFLFKKGK